MTDTPERQLLREVLTNSENDVGASLDEWENLFDRIRVLLDATQPETEFVWRVTVIPLTDTVPTVYSALSARDAKALASLWEPNELRVTKLIERAPIGPWGPWGR